MIKRMKSIDFKGEYDKTQDLKQFLLKNAEEKLGGRCLLIVYKLNRVYVGSIKNNEINVIDDGQFKLDYIIELRMFSESGELHLWKYGDEYKWRIRIDNGTEGGETNVYEEEHFLWGTKTSTINENELLEEHRGMKIQFPFKINNEPVPIKYQVRNYYDFDEDGMIKFFDARLVKIMNRDGGVIFG